MLFQIYMTYSFWKTIPSVLFLSIQSNSMGSSVVVWIIQTLMCSFSCELQIYECFTETSTAVVDVFNLLICLWLSNVFSSKLFNLKLFSMLCTFISKAKRPIPKLQFSNRIFNIEMHMQDTQLVTLTPSVEHPVASSIEWPTQFHLNAIWFSCESVEEGCPMKTAARNMQLTACFP